MEKDYGKRVNLLTMTVLIAVLVVVFRLGYLQLVHGSDYRLASDNNRYRQVLQLAPRGEILDTNGVTLASNKPGFFIAMNHTSDLQSKEVLEILSKIINPEGTDKAVTADIMWERLRANRYRRWQPVRLTDTALEIGRAHV